jgi:putative component of membrane protein insertase Oxa1/YidC/SpoIIIJ protein YidD
MVSDFVEIVSNPCGFNNPLNLIRYAKKFFKPPGFDTFCADKTSQNTHHERFMKALLIIRLTACLIAKLPAFLIIFLIKTFRPLFGPSGCCKYSPSCTQYAKQTLHTQSLHRACWLILKRVLSCW